MHGSRLLGLDHDFPLSLFSFSMIMMMDDDIMMGTYYYGNNRKSVRAFCSNYRRNTVLQVVEESSVLTIKQCGKKN
jgi:hypothetical protein